MAGNGLRRKLLTINKYSEFICAGLCQFSQFVVLFHQSNAFVAFVVYQKASEIILKSARLIAWWLFVRIYASYVVFDG